MVNDMLKYKLYLACLLLVCDVLCSLAIYPLPISTVSALFGAPVIIWIILKNNR